MKWTAGDYCKLWKNTDWNRFNSLIKLLPRTVIRRSLIPSKNLVLQDQMGPNTVEGNPIACCFRISCFFSMRWWINQTRRWREEENRGSGSKFEIRRLYRSGKLQSDQERVGCTVSDREGRKKCWKTKISFAHECCLTFCCSVSVSPIDSSRKISKERKKKERGRARENAMKRIHYSSFICIRAKISNSVGAREK